jgi:hypothetical protein
MALHEKITENYWHGADLRHPWAKMRVPRLRSYWAEANFEAAVVVSLSDELWGHLEVIEPTEAEGRAIASFIEYKMTYYNEGWAAKMREKPFDTDDTTNPFLLYKTAKGWRYRLCSWKLSELSQKTWSPDLRGLTDLLMEVNVYGRFPEWAASHADIFAADNTSDGVTIADLPEELSTFAVPPGTTFGPDYVRECRNKANARAEERRRLTDTVLTALSAQNQEAKA